MSHQHENQGISRRELLGALGKAAALTVVLPPVLRDALSAEPVPPHAGAAAEAAESPLKAVAGPDRVAVQSAGGATRASGAKTYLNGWAGYGEPPWRREPWHKPVAPVPGPAATVRWSKEAGPGDVAFEDATSLVTTATFAQPGTYVVRLTAENGESKTTTSFTVTVEPPPRAEAADIVEARGYRIEGPVWGRTTKALITTWIPQCVAQLERTDLTRGSGGLDNFVEAAKALRGEPHGKHKGYVFSNAYVHNTVEAMCVALQVDAHGDAEILAAQAAMRATLDRWIPTILAAQHPDGYLHTSFTLRDTSKWRERWTPEARGNHEGYTGGYFIDAAIAHHRMTGGHDRRLYDAARKLADCWDAHIGPAPKQEWYDGHQAMEMALIRLARYVDETEGDGATAAASGGVAAGKTPGAPGGPAAGNTAAASGGVAATKAAAGPGERYFRLAKFLLDCRGRGDRGEGAEHGPGNAGYEYDQSHAPVVQQYEAVGHAVRAAYLYSAMTDVAMRTRDADYTSAVRSIWKSIAERKYYVTGGIGSGETSEGFGPEYSLPNDGYCESCSSCAEIMFQARMNRLYRDPRAADLLEDALYNALLGSLDLQGKHYYYDNPPDANVVRYVWHDCPCCVGNIPRTLLSLPEWTYLRARDGLYVNLFVGGSVHVEDVAGVGVRLVQETGYPWNGDVRIRVHPERPAAFALRIRVPNRAPSPLYRATPASPGDIAIRVNGRAVRAPVERGYAVVSRRWAPGDVVDLSLPMTVQRLHPDPRIKQLAGRVALKYGPLLYNIESADQDISLALDARAPLVPEWRPDLLGGVTVIRGRFVSGAPLLAIPNFARYNRAAQPTEYPLDPPKPADGSAPKPFAATSILWIKEA